MNPSSSSSSSYYAKSIPRTLNLSGAEIVQGCGNSDLEDERYPDILLPYQSSNGVSSLLSLDIGGTLIKLVYFSRNEDQHTNGGGRLHFKKFETAKIEECLDFIESRQLHRGGIISQGRNAEALVNENVTIKATGGGAYRFADMFKERLGVSIEKEDEIACAVAGANFLLKAISHEAFTHMEGQKKFVQINKNDLFPYLLVNIGSGVGMIKVDDGKHERVTGTSIGGGTYLGLASLLTRCRSFDELLEMSQRGDNKNVDMLVRDIYGSTGYAKIGLPASTIASCFGKVISESKKLEDCRPEDISVSLLRMISFQISQIAHYEAKLSGLKRIFFGGFFVRDHAYTMDTISFAVDYWSKSGVKAMFLRHEGFLGALGAFMSYESYDLSAGAPCIGEEIHSPLTDLSEKSCEIIVPVPMEAPGDHDEEALLAELEIKLEETKAKIEEIKKRKADKILQKD